MDWTVDWTMDWAFLIEMSCVTVSWFAAWPRIEIGLTIEQQMNKRELAVITICDELAFCH